MRSLLIESIHDGKIPVIRKGSSKDIQISKANVKDLVAIVQKRLFKSVFIKTTTAEKIRTEVNKLKHRVLGVLPQDAVTFDEAIEALKEIIDLLCSTEAEQELAKLYGAMVPPS